MKRILLGAGLAIGLVGCGSPGAAFVGTWSTSSGTTVITCSANGQSNVDTESVTGNQTIVEGTDSDIVLTDSSGCNVKFNVAGKVATVVAGQSCTDSNVTFNITTSTITLGSDDKSFTWVASISATVNENGTDISCSGTITASATKVGK